MRFTADKVQLTAKGTTLSNIGELLQDCMFKIVESVTFLQLNCKLGFLSYQRG